MSNLKKDVQFPVGRVLMGSLYTASDKDADGKPRIVKTGKNAGAATQQYFFAVGFPKTPGKAHWAYETWGAEIYAVGCAAFPSMAQNPAFAWKIVDGDSTVPNKKNIKPRDREGYPGNWVVSFASTYAPKVVNSDGSAYIVEEGAVMPGDFVEVHATIDGNGSTQNPGVYINHNIVSFQGYSAEGRIMQSKIDPTTLGFGKGAKPAGLTMAPPASMPSAPAPAAPAAPAPAMPMPPIPGAPATPAPAAPAAPLPLAPSPAFLAPAAPVAPPAPAAPAARPMLRGFTYEALKAQGWSDAQMVDAGHMAAS